MTPLQKVSSMWDRYAQVWDAFFNLGRRKDAVWRRRAVEQLHLKAGDWVLDLACGTGLNFEFIEEAIGCKGVLIGLDFSPKMLMRAREKIIAHEWENVLLVLADASNFRMRGLNAILCTWAMVSIPNYKAAINNLVESLRFHGRVSILDFKLEEGLIGRLLNPVYSLPFRMTYQDLNRRPWEELEHLLGEVERFEGRFFGLPTYIVSGVKR